MVKCVIIEVLNILVLGGKASWVKTKVGSSVMC